MIELNEPNEILAPSLIGCVNSSTEHTLIIGELDCFSTLSSKGVLSKLKHIHSETQTGIASPTVSGELKQHL